MAWGMLLLLLLLLLLGALLHSLPLCMPQDRV
jgi:hypothetical protein